MKQFSRGIQTKIKNKIKKEAACKKEAGGDAKHVSFFTWPYVVMTGKPETKTKTFLQKLP